MNGTRLRARVWTANGVEVFSTWHDNVLNVDCAPEAGPQGIRCGPMQTSVYYADAACTASPMVVLPPCAVPTHITDFKSNRQGPVRAVGGVVTPPAQLYVDYNDGRGCQPTPGGGPGLEFHDATTVVPDPQLVTFTVQRETRGGRLAADVLVGSDGSRDARFIADTQRSIHCGPRNTFFSQERCFPATLAFAYARFADNACTQRLGTVPLLPQREPFMNEPPGVVVVDFNAVPEPLLQEPGAPYTGNAVYQLLGNMCQPYLDLSPGLFVELGGPTVPVSAFAPFVVTPEGAQRLQVTRVASDSGELLYREDFTDTQLGNAPCLPLPASDGSVRCMPVFDFSNAFADASCQQLLVQRLNGETPPVAVVHDRYVDQCNRTYEPLRVGNPLPSGDTIYTDGGNGTCYPISMTPGSVYYTTTALLPAELEEVTLVTQ